MLKTISIISKKENTKLLKRWKSSYSTTKTYRNSKYYWYKISYYRTSKSGLINFKISVMNSFNDVWLDTYILQINNQKIRKADKLYDHKLDFKDISSQRSLKNWKEEFYQHRCFWLQNKKKYPIYASTNCREDKHDDLLLIEEKEKERGTMFLSDILTY